ncbi:MAG: hypothetical protein ABI520_15900 [Caldimonas sp.]
MLADLAAAKAVWMYSTGMDRDASEFADMQWVARCAHRLRRQWPHADVESLEEAALELWRVNWLREMPAEAAAELWLRPLSGRPPGAAV